MNRLIGIGPLGMSLAGLLALLAMPAGGSGEGACNREPVADTLRYCAGCHSGGLSLADRDTAELAATIRAMRDGKRQHPAPLPALSDDDIVAVANALTCD